MCTYIRPLSIHYNGSTIFHPWGKICLKHYLLCYFYSIGTVFGGDTMQLGLFANELSLYIWYMWFVVSLSKLSLMLFSYIQKKSTLISFILCCLLEVGFIRVFATYWCRLLCFSGKIHLSVCLLTILCLECIPYTDTSSVPQNF